VAHAFVPRPSGVDAVVFATPPGLEGLTRHDLIGVSGQVVHAELAGALGLAPTPDAFPESRQLLRITLRHLGHVGPVPLHVPMALARVTLETIGKRLHLRTFTGESPFTLRAQAFAVGDAFHLSLVK